jgi:metal-sulfur cluster biosynthetic enzyme
MTADSEQNPGSPSTGEASITDLEEHDPNVEEIWEVLKQVQDPELHMGIVDLGLVYHVDIDDDGLVSIDLTLTSPGCPIGPMIQGQAYHLLTQLPGVEDVEVNLVWDPPWDPRTMASDEVKMMLGIW